MTPGPRRVAARIALLAALALALASASLAAAQTTLRIDGRDVGQVRTDLLAGTAYAPLDRIAEGLGARLAAPLGGDTAALTLGGHVVTVDVVETGQDPRRGGAIRADGVAAGDLAAIRGDDALWGPVAAIVRAFGGQVAYLPEANEVVALLPRPTVLTAELDEANDVETLRLRLAAPVSWTRFDDPETGRAELVLRRAELDLARTLGGRLMDRVDLLPDPAGVRIRIDAPGTILEVLALPDGAGTDLRIRARAARPDAEPTEATPRATVALDPGAAAPDGDALLELARATAERLEADGVDARLTRDGPAPAPPDRRLAAAAQSTLLVALRAADLPAGEVRIWVLGDASTSAALDMAIRRNAETALASGDVDALRREVLAGLVPDLEVGRRAATAVASALFQLGGYRAGDVGEAPLAALAPAAGRGILIEVGRDDVGSPRLPDALAAALRSALSGSR